MSEETYKSSRWRFFLPWRRLSPNDLKTWDVPLHQGVQKLEPEQKNTKTALKVKGQG